ncbi:class I mannose-6-phosphate isomerase [Liquorilactobacillus oeni]|uniref:Mannose-6-phosphate isomerase n=1 Tax=Liquorilactobacillus oeni DSM 19972 TaxID=1423777 RepID=A0A0R1MIG6_9LACO|nr:class I mannose-6-phosphate isomerase [Liquorilactobacillus oeni]KRL05074.1 mannose-6-phosphate isomerase [Liquorilactobacillus oeni DSM 19972]
MDENQLNVKVADKLTTDRVFGRMTQYSLEEFYPDYLEQRKIFEHPKGLNVIYGTGAAILAPEPDILIYCDLARWKIQLRYRAGMSNWHRHNEQEDALRKFKGGYFLDWRWADQLKKQLLPKMDFYLDTNIKKKPRMIAGIDLLHGLAEVITGPYRTVPYFDESVWGGCWMKKNFKLSDSKPNYGWAFDGVPEENSLYLRYGTVRIEVPATNLLLVAPQKVLGVKVYARFGAEFPLRFDYLDTVKGGNLSLQVHPLTEYIKAKYGMGYTQDESYYILKATPKSAVYLGVKDDVNKEALSSDLKAAEEGKLQFAAEKYVNKFPAKQGDHFLIPAGTIHCGGSETVILEISATPYIFTFKMWDWGRVGLDKKPRPIHLKEGLDNLQWQRDTKWVKENLINHVIPISLQQNEVIERTGLAESFEFIETWRHRIKTAGKFENHGSVNMLNMVVGEKAVVKSPHGSFADFEIHFGETFIVPAMIEEYLIEKETDKEEIIVLQAFVK